MNDENAQIRIAKTIREAAEDGTLIDVSENGKRVGMRCRTFISQGFWNKVVNCSHDDMGEILAFLSRIYHHAFTYERLGPADFGRYSCFLEPNEEFGLVMVITEYLAENDLGLKRTTGNISEYVV